MNDAGEKREAELTSAQVEEYRLMCSHASGMRATVEYFERRRRKLEDEFAQLLGFEDRIDAKRQAFSLQIYLYDRMVRAHNKNTTATVSLGVPLTGFNMKVYNNSSVAIFLGDEKGIRPRDGRTMTVEPGGALQFPGRMTELFMAADSRRPLPVQIIEMDNEIVQVNVGDPS